VGGGAEIGDQGKKKMWGGKGTYGRSPNLCVVLISLTIITSTEKKISDWD
jgi:hypothetical protein